MNSKAVLINVHLMKFEKLYYTYGGIRHSARKDKVP